MFTKKLTLKLEIIFAGLVFVLLVILAFSKNWHYDEAYSIYIIPDLSVKDIVLFSNFRLANNHVFNSLYFKLVYELGLRQYIFYRLLSLFAFVIFVYGNLRFFEIFKVKKPLVIFVLMAAYLRYFAMGRGYALALASFTMALVYLLLFKQNYRVKYGYLFTFWAIISSLSVFSFVFGIASLFVLYAFYSRKQIFSLHFLLQSLLFAFVLVYIYLIGRIINQTSSIISAQSFWGGTVSSIIGYFFRTLNFYFVPGLAKYDRILRVFVIIFIVFVPLFSWLWEKDGKEFFAKAFDLIFVLIFSLLLIFLAHIFSGAKYPVYRAVMFLYYILLLIAILAYNQYRKWLYLLPLTVFLSIYLVYYFSLVKDLSHLSHKQIIAQTRDYPVIYTSSNKNLRVLNDSSTKRIYNVTNFQVINQLLNHKLKSDFVYILTTPNDTAFIHYRKKWQCTKAVKARENRILLELKRKD